MIHRSPRITEVRRHTLHVPFTAGSAQWNALLVGQWGVVELVEVRTEDPDITGWGESVPAYTSRTVSDEAISSLVGERAAEHLWDARLGMGLQMALFDAVGKQLQVPMSRLLNLPVVRDAAPIAWWSTKMPPEALAAEAERAVASGYRAHKFKARPWFDPFEQVDAIARVTPDDYRLDIDWNRMLLDRPTALRVLGRLDEHPKVGIFEAPMADGNFDDYRLLRERLRHPIVEHFDQGPFAPGALAHAYDGYVFSPNTQGEGVGGLLRQGILAEAFNKSGWMQMVGTALTTAFTLHLTSVLPAARWPLVTAMNIYQDDLATAPIRIADGLAHVPDGPGLGIDVDVSTVERFAVDHGYRIDYPRTILSLSLPGGGIREYATMAQMWRDCREYGNVPLTGEGARLFVRADDGSTDFDREHRALTNRPRWR